MSLRGDVFGPDFEAFVLIFPNDRGVEVEGLLECWFSKRILLAVVLPVPTVLMYRRESWILSLALGIGLMLPLARIGFCPIILKLARHR